MLIQTLVITVEAKTTIPEGCEAAYSLSRDQNGEFTKGDITVTTDTSAVDISHQLNGIEDLTPKLLGLSVLPYDFHAKEAYVRFSDELKKGILNALKLNLKKFEVLITQAGYNFQLLD